MYDIQNSADAIRRIQLCLLELSYTMREIPQLVVDGIYGDKTRNAVQVFQQESGLTPTGRTDYKTWQFLYEAYEQARDNRESDNKLLHFQFDLFEDIQGGS